MLAKAMAIVLLGSLTITNGAAVVAQDSDRPKMPAMLLQPQELEQITLLSSELRILDTRSEAEYAKSHIPGAIRVDVKSWQQLGSKEGGFHDVKAWGKAVGELGIDANSQVVVYGSSVTDTARVWWLLKYVGLTKVSILDGGWQMWIKEKHATDNAIRNVGAVHFQSRFQSDRLEEMDALKKNLGSSGVTLLDTRSSDEFTGKEIRGKRGGHIPGAKLLEWKDLLAEDGRFKSRNRLRDLFRERGIQPEQTTICY